MLLRGDDMREINIAKVITSKRREKGLTQEELASYMGVSKASVSKWETGQSYPDIVFLPQLATFFNISMDELMDYEPQMCKEDIRKLYIRLAADFTIKPFKEVLENCRETVKKYYSCFPLLFQMGVLLVNNSVEAANMEQTLALITEAKEIFTRVKNEGKDAELARNSLNMEAFCALTLGQAEETVELLEGVGNTIISCESVLAPAYQMLGKHEQAKSVMQTGIYQYMGTLISTLTNYLSICMDTPEQFEETCKRALAVANAFDIEHLHPALLVKLYLVAAQGYASFGDINKVLEILGKYKTLVMGDIYPLKLKGDAYFNLLEEWIDELDLGNALPRDEKIVRQSMVDGIAKNPAFASLENNKEYQIIVDQSKNLL